MTKRILTIITLAAAFVACEKAHDLNSPSDVEGTRYVAKVEVEADDCATRAYDSSLNWNWESTDALVGYQVAGGCLRNTLTFLESNSSFVCEAFEYMSTDANPFHFIYPAAAEVSAGVLVAVQDGTWRPLCVTTTESALIESLPTLTFDVLSSAFEIRIFAEDKATPYNVVQAKLVSDNQIVGKWTLQDDMTYVQSLEGYEYNVKGIDASVVVFNMPDMPEGYGDGTTLSLALTDAEGNTMMRDLPAMTFVKGKRTILNVAFTPDSTGDSGSTEEPVEPDPVEPEVITGTFTCATYNVDGLPAKILGFISLNSDGPGSDGTTSISQKIATSGWDVVTFQENFTYNDELTSSMSSYYTFGTHREFNLLNALSTADTDGLGFATLNSTCSFSGETWEAFTDAYGGLTDGANTSLKKGIRHYVVTFADGVQVDFLVTHMNSGADSGHITARQSQLAQIAAYINSIRGNNRPIVFMGDTNCRYTRDDMFTYLFNKLDSDLTYADPWVDFSWNGVYPTLGSASLMVPSKDSSSTLTEQTGEVVDKIIYFNNPNAPAQIQAKSYFNNTDYAGMADHNPVVAEFTYTYTVTE